MIQEEKSRPAHITEIERRLLAMIWPNRLFEKLTDTQAASCAQAGLKNCLAQTRYHVRINCRMDARRLPITS
jgi:hypothetical protein